ncbi:MAG: putative peptidase [Candidatus Scalindua rubra]|uniref:Putative peptidase n=1 Tax=Candidatus Scalindua rubra TaxID=1872076 RepID=A0A1E3X6B3_9BACT|nr:MAG: putative peptidase [Candidatus Scalindua rubra]
MKKLIFLILLITPITSGIPISNLHADDCEKAKKYFNKAYKIKNNPEKKISLYKKAIELCPDHAAPHINLGNVYDNQGRYDEAIIEYKEALRINPDDTEAHRFLAKALEKIEKNEEALEHWKRYIELKPNAEDIQKARSHIDTLEQKLALKKHKPIPEQTPVPKPGPVIADRPQITLLKPKTDRTTSSTEFLEAVIQGVEDIKHVIVKVNAQHVEAKKQTDQRRGIEVVPRGLLVEALIDLIEGKNKIEIIATNDAGTASHTFKLLYNPIKKPLYNETWAVIIGIDKYENALNLNYAVRDARNVEGVIQDDFNFQHVISIHDNEATFEKIKKILTVELKKQTHKDDGVLIFFAGHGVTETTIDGKEVLGYLVPTDGTNNPDEYALKNISMNQIKDWSKRIKAKHIFFVFDTCFSGLFLAKRYIPKARITEVNYERLVDKTRERVRQALAAGTSKQKVLDGVFTGYLADALKGAADEKGNEDGYITAEEVARYVTDRVEIDAKYKGTTQNPQSGNLYGEGVFVFPRK